MYLQLALSSADDVGNYLAGSTLSLTGCLQGRPSRAIPPGTPSRHTRAGVAPVPSRVRVDAA